MKIRPIATLMLVLAPLYLAGCLGLNGKPYHHRATANPSSGYIILLPGVRGPAASGNPSFDDRQNDLLTAGLSSDVWNWPKHPSMKWHSFSYALDPANCDDCARELVAQINNAPPPVSILAASAGCQIAVKACADPNLHSNAVKEVVLISPAFDRNFGLNHVKSATAAGGGNVWLYASSIDEAFLNRPNAAGRVGTDTPGVRQLKWSPSHMPDNDGTHMEAFRPGFFGQYITPIFTNPATVQTDWPLTP